MSMTLSGCSSFAELIPFEQDPINATSTKPIDKCDWPEMIENEDEAIVYMASSEFHKQVACQETEQKNYEIAELNGIIADDAIAAFNALVTKSKVHHQNAENELERTDDERKRKTLEVIGYQGLLALVLIAVAL